MALIENVFHCRKLGGNAIGGVGNVGDTYTSQGKGSVNISGQTIQVDELKTTIVNAPLSGGGGYTFIEAERTVIWKFPFSVGQGFFGGFITILLDFSGFYLKDSVGSSNWLYPFISYIPNWLLFSTLLLCLLWSLIMGDLMGPKRFLGGAYWGNLESSANKSLYYTQVTARCPLCSGEMAMERMVIRDGRKKMPIDYTLICKQNPTMHFIKFDMTTLPDVAEDYARRRRRQNDRPTHEDGDKTTREPHNDEAAREECSDEIENV